MLFALILFVLAAALVDVYRIQDIRTFAYSVANDAALAGASIGRNWGTFTATGRMTLHPSIARWYATARLENLMARRGLTAYTYQIEVLPEGGTSNELILHFPKVARASMFCTASPCVWTEPRPAVGVYVVVQVPTILFGLINGNQPISVHAFAAAAVVER